MKNTFFIIFLAISSIAMAQALPPITFRGQVLEYDSSFTRKQCGKSPTYIPEVSGMSCSRRTLGYFWVQSDEVFRIAAINSAGAIFSKVWVKDSPKYKKSTRRDWEGISTGLWNGKNYLFIGAFGDNDCQYKDNYYIIYMEEPIIGNVENPKLDTFYVNNNYIRYGYPDGKAHNTEAIMFDNVEQKIYIIDKEEHHFCHVYSLDMTVPHDTSLLMLTYECDLGQGDEQDFRRVTAADMTPDGRWIIIKNNYYETPAGAKEEETYAVALIWRREDGESVVDALKRQPKQILAYEVEWQGEAVAWLDSTTFYTTSDDDGRAPIYVYTRWKPTGLKETNLDKVADADKVLIDGQLYIRRKDTTYDIQGQEIK